MDNESYQDKIDYTVLVFVDTGTQTKRKVRSALCSYLIYCSNHFMTRFDSNAACIFAICVWYLYKINKNSTNYSPKSSACGGQVFLKMYYFSACGGQNQGGLCVEWGGLAKTEPLVGASLAYMYIYLIHGHVHICMGSIGFLSQERERVRRLTKKSTYISHMYDNIWLS